MHRTVAAALVAALALGIASCGGGEAALTRAQLVKKIELACREAQRQSQRRIRAITGSSNRSREAFITAVVDGQRAQLDRIEDLHPSDAVKADYVAFKDGLKQRLDLFSRLKSVGGANLQRALELASRASDALTTRVQEAARRLGVTGCV